ncbi:hypothetical protein IFM89_038999, partial [Coptis chinensis]
MDADIKDEVVALNEETYFRFERNRNELTDEAQRSLERVRHRSRERERRQSMTDEQRVLERERRRIRDEQRRKNLSDEQRALEKERRRTRERQRRNNMNDEQRAVEMERRRIRERQHRQNMDDEQRSKDRERRRQRDKQRRENMNEEQRAQERERRRSYEQRKRGNVMNEQVVSRRKQATSQNDEISEAGLGNQNVLYSSDTTDVDQMLALTNDNLQIEGTNTSERSSTTTLDLKEGEMVVFHGIHTLGNQNASCSREVTIGNQILPLMQSKLQVEATNTSEQSSTTAIDHNEGVAEVYRGEKAIRMVPEFIYGQESAGPLVSVKALLSLRALCAGSGPAAKKVTLLISLETATNGASSHFFTSVFSFSAKWSFQ